MSQQKLSKRNAASFSHSFGQGLRTLRSHLTGASTDDQLSTKPLNCQCLHPGPYTLHPQYPQALQTNTLRTAP